jgi:hypothetical protein
MLSSSTSAPSPRAQRAVEHSSKRSSTSRKPALGPGAEGQLTLPRHLEGLARPGPLDANEGVRDEERAPQVDLHGITDRYGMRTANFVAMHLEYPTPSASQ